MCLFVFMVFSNICFLLGVRYVWFGFRMLLCLVFFILILEFVFKCCVNVVVNVLGMCCISKMG